LPRAALLRDPAATVKIVRAVQMGDSATRAFQRFRLFVALGLAVAGAALMTVPASAQTTTLPGIDVSHWQGNVDWSQVQSTGTKFVFAKATEGKTIADPQYAANKQGVEAQAMPFGAYHFARPGSGRNDAVKQADWFVSNAQLTGDNLLPVLDLEASGGLGAKKLKAWAQSWLAEVQAKLGVKAIIYTGPSFWKSAMGNTTWFADNGYPLWIAHYTSAAQPTVPASNWGGHGWTLWQYTNAGTVSGVDGNVDQDRYNGSGLAPLKIKNNL
jgi:lysozyme